MQIVEISITGSTISGDGVSVGAAGSHRDYALQITFNSAWDGLSKRIIWQNAHGLNTVYTLLDDSMLKENETSVYIVPIPSEPKEFPGTFNCSVKGIRLDQSAIVEVVYAVQMSFNVGSAVTDITASEAEEAKTAAISEQLQAEIDGKVQKVEGKGLSTNDYDDTEKGYVHAAKNKLSTIESGAQVNVLEGVKVDGTELEITDKKVNIDLSKLADVQVTDDKWVVKNKTLRARVGIIDDGDLDVRGYVSVTGWSYIKNNSDKTLQDEFDGITGKIPAQASSSNQLADKAFVNSSIATETAHYISNNGEPFTSAASLPTSDVTNNDYAFVTGTDSDGNTFYDRYKATVSGSTVTWAKEYRLNNSSFTAVQWAAITSGITSVLVGKLNDIDLTQYYTKSQADALINPKYEKPQTGIPKTDLAADVQAAVDDVDVAMRVAMYGSNIKPSNNSNFDFGYSDVPIDKYVVVAKLGATLTGTIIIPYEWDDGLHGKKPVYNIQETDGAFLGQTGITKVIIPKTVTKIASKSFKGCSGLTEIYIPDSVVEFGTSLSDTTIFEDCSSDLVVYCNKGSTAETYCQTNGITYAYPTHSDDFKTINGNSILGDGDIVISGGGDVSTVTLSGDNDVTIQASQGDIEIKTQGTYNASTNPIATKNYVDTKNKEQITVVSDTSDVTSPEDEQIVMTLSPYPKFWKYDESGGEWDEIFLHYDHSDSSLSANTVQGAIDELDGKIGKEYKLIQRHITGYSILEDPMPTYAANTYYENTGTVKEPVYTLLTSGTAPEDWEDTPNTKYYEQVATTAMPITFRQDTAGNNYDFDKLFLYVNNLNSDNTYKPTFTVRVFPDGHNGYDANTTISNLSSIEILAGAAWRYEVEKKFGRWCPQYVEAAVGNWLSSDQRQRKGSMYRKANADSYISGIELSPQVVQGVQTVIKPDIEIEIWGVER